MTSTLPDMKRMTTGLIRAGLMSAGLLSMGCADEVEPGSLTVTWRTAGRSCADGAITEVQALLYSFRARAPVAEAMVPCDSGTVRLDDIKPGGYSLALRGFQGDCWTHGARREDVVVRDDEDAEVIDLPLDRRRRTVSLSWGFPDDGGCVEHGVEQIEIEVAVRGTVTRVVPSLCRAGGLLIPDVAPGALYLTLLAYDANGTPVMRGETAFSEGAFDMQCTEVIDIEVPLSLCEGPTC